jgi:hypothetical protein
MIAVALAALFVAGCDDDPPKKEKPSTKETAEPAKSAAPAAPVGPPEISVDDLGPKIGFTRVLLDKPEGRDRLSSELGQNKQYLEGKDVKVSAVRNAKMMWMMTLMNELGKIGAAKVIVKTETRKEYPGELTFTPEAKAPTPEACTLTGMVLEDRSTAIWKVTGGTAMRRSKGFAGPDLSMTADTIERLGKACKQSNMFLVSAADAVEWGLAYDLAATSKTITDVKFETLVLLEKTPVAGRKVEMGKP